MRILRHWRLGFLLLVAVGAGAYLFLRGGEDAGPELTPAEYVERANEVCAALAQENLELAPPPVPYGAMSEPFFQGFNDNVTAARERLAELNPPAADEDEADRLLETLNLVATRAQEASGAASVDQSSEVDALVEEMEGLAAQAAESEQRLGICPGRTSFRVSIGTVVGRRGENPLTETGTLG